MKNTKVSLFLQGILTQIQANKGRTVLTTMGVVLAAILFLLGTVLTDTYMNMLYSDANDCSKEGVLLSGALTEDVINDMKVKFHEYNKTEFLNAITSFTYDYLYEDISLSVMPMVIGTTSRFTNNPVRSTQGTSMMYNTKITQGRDIQDKDLEEKKRVVVISQFAADIFFPEDSAIGKQIAISLTGEETEKVFFEVVGVYKNSYDEKTVYKLIKNAQMKHLEGVNVQLNFYIPKTVYCDYSDYIGTNVQSVVVDTKNNVEIKKRIEQYYSTTDTIEVSYSEKMIKMVKEINKDLILVMRCIMVVMMIIAGFNLFNSLMFSIRERISEIGIKKALGAENIDILSQFLIEGIVISILGALVAVAIVTVLLVIAQIVLQKTTVLYIDIVFSINIILEMFCYTLIMAIVFSFIPAWIASKTNIIDAIRFD